MPAKTSLRKKSPSAVRLTRYGRQLRKLMKDHQTLTMRLAKLAEYIEDEEDHRRIVEAEKRNAGKPGIPWEEAKKILGLKF